MWRLWAKALGAKEGKNDREANAGLSYALLYFFLSGY